MRELIGLVIVGLVLVVLFLLLLKRKYFGVLAGKSVYTDTVSTPGEVMYSERLKLKGKPDYVIKKGKEYVPVELKTGKTPSVPYKNHLAQLFAYCILVEENYGIRPKYGVIKYPKREFEIEFTLLNEQRLEDIIQEMQEIKLLGREPTCIHPEHNL